MWVGTREEFETLRARAETPADLLRLAREAAAKQEPDVAELDAETETIWRSDFEELAYMTPGRTVLRFRGLDDVSLPDANARAMAAQILGGAEGVVPVADVKAALEGGAAEGPEPEVVAAVRQAANEAEAYNATIQEAVEARAAAEDKLVAIEEHNRAQTEIILDYLEAAGLPRDSEGDARAGLREISRLVALADVVREIVGGPADAEALRAKLEEARDIPRMLSEWLGFEVRQVSCAGGGWATTAAAFDEPRHGLVVGRLEQKSDSFGGGRCSQASLQAARPLKIDG